MQRTYLLLVSHLGAKSEQLLAVLNQNRRIVMHGSISEYRHPDDLQWMVGKGHKDSSTGAIYGDRLLYNMQMGNSELYKFCKFIYLVRSAKDSLNHIVHLEKYSPISALRYYCYRLRRMCEMAKRTPGAVFLTWDDLSSGKGFDLIEEYLGLKEMLKLGLDFFTDLLLTDKITSDLVKSGDECYERHLFYVKQLDLRMV
jgi:hypothetical protein